MKRALCYGCIKALLIPTTELKSINGDIQHVEVHSKNSSQSPRHVAQPERSVWLTGSTKMVKAFALQHTLAAKAQAPLE